MLYFCHGCEKVYEHSIALNKHTVRLAVCINPDCNYKICERCTDIDRITKSPCPICRKSMWSTALLKEMKTKRTIRDRISDFFAYLINLKYR